MMNRILAAAATASPTLATPETEAEFCLIRSAVISSRSWSPGTTGRAQLDVVHRGQHGHAACSLDRRGDENAAGLGHGLDDQDARHDGPSRPVSLEERLVDAHVLDRHQRLAALDLEHAVDHREGIAVRNDLHDALDINGPVLAQGQGRRPRAVLSLQALEEFPHQRGVGVVARPVGHDEAVQVHPQQCQVADHVEHLVPGALVGESERVAHDAVRAEDQDVGLGGASADAGGLQGPGLGFQQEGSASRQLAAKRGRE